MKKEEQTAIEYIEQLVRFSDRYKYKEVSVSLLRSHIKLLKKYKKINWAIFKP